MPDECPKCGDDQVELVTVYPWAKLYYCACCGHQWTEETPRVVLREEEAE